MWVKICGNTNLEDAALAVELGADAVGFVFAASPRRVTPEQVAAISRELPAGTERVGVFDSHNSETIAEAAMAAGLTAVQLHGGFDEELLQQLGQRLAGGMRIIQTLHWTVGQESAAIRIAAQVERIVALGIADRVLIDSKRGLRGGWNRGGIRLGRGARSVRVCPEWHAPNPGRWPETGERFPGNWSTRAVGSGRVERRGSGAGPQISRATYALHRKCARRR